MQTDLLFDQFDTLLTTPDDVAHLEAAVLQLAVRGKLGPQDPTDEPATKLFERILAEKERLVRKGQIRKPKPLPPIEADEIPYELPESWAWVRLGEATNYGTSDKVKASDIVDDTWVLDLQDIEKVTSRLLARVKFGERQSKSSKNVFHSGDVLYGKLRPYLDKVLVVDADGVCSSEIIPMRGYLDIDPQYLRYALKRPDFIAYVNSKTYGVKMPRLGTPDARMAVLPLPPLAEQKRIVAKVDELLAQTRALAAQLEQADAALVPAAQAAFQSLLNAQDTTAQDEAWQRIADYFDTLTSAPRTIAALKQTVLQLAVQGKLVPQDPDDEPASVLVERIEAEKKQQVREGTARKRKPLSSLKSSEVPYELPASWAWIKLDEIAEIAGGVAKGRNLSGSETIVLPYLRVANVQRGYLDLSVIKKIEIKVEEQEKYLLKNRDLLLTEGGDADKLGRSAIWREEIPDCIHQNHIFRARPYLSELASEWIMLCTNSRYGRDYFLSSAKQTTNLASINMTQLRNLPVALPPLPEQKRIFAKVEALLALCDALAVEVAAAEEVRARLLQAVLNGG